jgi:hypothetical protein
VNAPTEVNNAKPDAVPKFGDCAKQVTGNKKAVKYRSKCFISIAF